MLYKICLFWLPLLGFLVGMVWRFHKLMSSPAHLRWELYPIPHESASRAQYGGSRMEEYGWWKKQAVRRQVAVWTYILEEVLTLKSLHKNQHRMHYPSLFLHWGVYLVLTYNLFIFGASIFQEFPKIIYTSIRLIGLIGGALGLLGASGLTAIRLLDPELRGFTKLTRFAGLSFLGLLFASKIMLLTEGTGMMGQEIGLVRYSMSLSPFPGNSGLILGDLTLTAIFWILIPWTQFSHSFAKFFTFHSVRWDDKELEPDDANAKSIASALHGTPGWSASHLGPNGSKTWKEIATEGNNAS